MHVCTYFCIILSIIFLENLYSINITIHPHITPEHKNLFSEKFRVIKLGGSSLHRLPLSFRVKEAERFREAQLEQKVINRVRL